MADNPYRQSRSINPYREAAAPPKQDAVGTATGAARAFGQGVTFGFGDEMEAGIHALIDRQDGEDFTTAYRRHKDRISGQVTQFREQSPVTAIGSEVAGGLVGPGAVTAKAGGAIINAGQTALRQAGRAAAVGAAEGAVYGAGAADSVSDIPESMAKGAAIGGAAGGGLSAVFSGLRGGAAMVRGVGDPQFGADVRVAQAMARDGTTPQEVAQRLHEARTLGRPATIADMGGKNMQAELELVAQRPGAAQNAVEEFMSTRNKDQLRRLSRDLVRATGSSGDDVASAIESTMVNRADAATPVYARAMEYTAEMNDDIVAAYNRAAASPLGKQALVKAKRILNLSDFDDAPLMMRIDAFKKGLDDVIQSARQSGDRQIARAGTRLLRTDDGSGLLDLVDAANPAYRQAREIWSDGQSYLDSIDAGRNIMKPSTTAAATQREWRTLTDAEREAYRIGAVDAIVTRMRQQSAQEPNLLKLLRSPEIRDKLEVMMSPRDAARFGRLIDIEEKMFRTSNVARGNSRTAARTAAMDEQEKQARLFAALGLVVDLATVGVRPLLFRGIPALTGAAKARLLARQSDAIAQRLLSGDPASLGRSAGVAPTSIRPPGRVTAAATPAAIAPMIEDSPQ